VPKIERETTKAEWTVDELVRLAASSGLVHRGPVEVADGRTLLEFGVRSDFS
jgi:hypothetical protein